MSNIEWIGLPTLVLGISLFLVYLMLKVRAKYIHIEYFLVKSPEHEPYAYEEERYGCVSLLATVLGILFSIAAVASLIMLLYQIVVVLILPSVDLVISVVGVLYGIILVFSLLLFVAMAIVGFFRDLLNPPR